MRLLFVEDDTEYIDGMLADISKEYVVDVAHTGEEGAYLSEVNDYDLIVVSGGQDDQKGIEKCVVVKECCRKVPVVFLAKEINDQNILKSLECGADYCLPKKASLQDVKKGLRAVIKRKHLIGSSILCVRSLSYDLDSKKLIVNGFEIFLRRKELDILELLLINKGRTVSKEELLEHIWTAGIYSVSNTVEVHINHIRKKIEKPFGLCFIKTVKGFGYRIEA